MNEKVREQILAVRDTGQTNMFDINAVGRIAMDHGYNELASFLEDKTKEYVHFILTGESEKAEAAFMRKPARLEDLVSWDKVAKQRSRFAIETTIELEKSEFEYFANDLFADQDFIKENIELMRVDKNGIRHCILVKAIGQSDGILVESEGYEYARYAAYLKG